MKRETPHAPPKAKPDNGAPPAEGLQRIAQAQQALEAGEERVTEARKKLAEATAERDRLADKLRVTIHEETDPSPKLF